MFDMLPPALVLLAGALLIGIVRGRARDERPDMEVVEL